MAQEFKNKIIVVTGGAQGIGFQIIKHFLDKDAKQVIILDINEKLGEEAAATFNAEYGKDRTVFIKCDVMKDIDVVTDTIFKSYTVDVLVNNAGVLREDSVMISLGINTIAVMELSFKFFHHMRTDKGGKGGTIINISSIFGYRVGPLAPIYFATKFAVLGFTRCIGHEYNFKRSGVRSVTVCPGLTRSNMSKHSICWEPELLQEYCNKISETDFDWQETEDVGKGVVEVFEKAASGSAWLVEGGRPAVELTSF